MYIIKKIAETDGQYGDTSYTIRYTTWSSLAPPLRQYTMLNTRSRLVKLQLYSFPQLNSTITFRPTLPLQFFEILHYIEATEATSWKKVITAKEKITMTMTMISFLVS